MESVIGKTFRNEDIVLDATKKFYVNCKFVQCRLVYMGGDPPFVNCQFEGQHVTFGGEAARVLSFMHTMGMLPVGQPVPPPAIGQQPESPNLH